MTQSRLWKAAAVISGILVLCSLAVYAMSDPEPTATYGMIPGMRVGRFLGPIISVGTTSNSHGASMTMIVVIASIVDFMVYAAVVYAVLSLASFSSRNVKVRY
jgi:hypothetical protein